MIRINTISNNKAWHRYIKNPGDYIENKVDKINCKLTKYKKKKIFCTLLLSGDSEIKKLNKKFRNKNNTTDVLSFPFYNKRVLKNKLRNNGIKISPKGIKNLKFSSNVNEFVIQCMLLKKKLNPKIVPNIKRFILYGFFLYVLLDFFFIKTIK